MPGAVRSYVIFPAHKSCKSSSMWWDICSKDWLSSLSGADQKETTNYGREAYRGQEYADMA